MKTILRHLSLAVAIVTVCGLPLVFAEGLVVPVSASASSSYRDQVPANANGNRLGPGVNLGGLAPAALVVDLGRRYSLSRVELLTAQDEPGTTEHEIAVSDDLVSWTPATTWRSETSDNQ